MRKWKVVFRPENDFVDVVTQVIVNADNFGDAMMKLGGAYVIKEIFSVTELFPDTPPPKNI